MNARIASEQHVHYEFGDFRLDSGRRLLFAKGRTDPVVLKAKVVETLLYLVERPGQLLEKDKLLADLWPGLVLAETSLAQVISALRHALGETPGENRYVATVSGRGYRFVADVRRIEETDRASEPAAAAPTVSPETGQLRRWILVATVTLVAALGAAPLYIYFETASLRAPLAASPPAEASAPIVSDPVATPLAPNSVAVLPFENLSANAEDAYFAFGVAEGVLHRLSQNRDLTLIARTSSFAVAAKPADARDIGRALNARYLVEGSVQRASERLRVTAQLIDASTGEHRWSLRFDRTVDDIFAVEDEIAQSIAEALEVSVVSDKHPYSRFGTEAYLAYLKGRALIDKRTIADAERAIERFSRTVEIAPDFAAAYAALADANMQRAFLLRGTPSIVFLDRPEFRGDLLVDAANKAEPLLAKALELDDSLGEAYILRADLKAITGDPDGAEADYRTGLELNPTYGVGYEHLATFLGAQNRPEEVEAAIDKAILVDPLSPRNFVRKGYFYYFSEETGVFSEQAEVYLLKALELAPDYHPALVLLGGIRWQHGRFAEAIRLGEQAVAVDPRSDWLRSYLVEFYLELGEVDAARSVLSAVPDSVHPIEWVAVCWYERDLERAVELVRTEPQGRGFHDHDVEAYVLRDAALASGNLARGREDLLTVLSRPHLPAEEDPFRLVTLAHMNVLLGHPEEAERLAREMVDWTDTRARTDKPYRLAYPKAAALALLGENDASFDLLEDSFERGYRQRWWYAFDRDPAFDALRSDPRFQDLAARAHAHADAERKLLEQMRERGEVPRRATEAANPGTC